MIFFDKNFIYRIIVASITFFTFTNLLQAQNVGINADGTNPNSNAMLDIVSPATGDGKGLLIPRVTQAQRTTADAGLAGGLLDGSGDLRGGAAHALLVFQTDGSQGFYYNTSLTATPNWVYIGTGNITTQNVPYTFQNANGTNGQFLQTNGAGAANWATVTVPLSGSTVTIGDSAATDNNGVAIGVSANGTSLGTVIGFQANACSYGTALGYRANGYDSNVAIGYNANGFTGTGPYSGGVSVGYRANSFSGDGKYSGGVAIGYTANARHNFNENDSGAVAVGFMANSFIRGAAVGYKSAGYNKGVALGYIATGSNNGVGIGYKANGYTNGTAIGYMSNAGNRNYSFAKGAYSKCDRYNEEWKTSDGFDNKFGYGQVNFHGSTTTASATEIYLGGVVNQRFILKDNSVVGFNMIVSAVNTNTGDSSVWHIRGGIERRTGAASTAIIGANIIDAITQGTLTSAPSVTADTTNGSLKLQVTGVNANTVKWNAAMTYSEVRE